MKISSILLCVTYFFIQSARGQCPPNCLCLGSSVTCIGLTSIPTMFPEDTRYLTISEIDVDQIPAGVFNRLPLLESIEIYDGSVGKISSDAFQSLSTLESITLSELSIGTIESYAFNNIKDTGSISLDMSTIDVIQPYAFYDIFALDFIKVSSNDVKYIDSFAFSKVSELLEFSFQGNHVNTMKPYAFSQFSDLYEFSVYLNTLGDIGCGSLEALLYQTEEMSFYSNKFNCTCNNVWAAKGLKKYLFSNSCQLPGTEVRISWENVSMETLNCIDSDKYQCPSAELVEMSIPNVRITTTTTETSTRPISTPSQTSSNTELPKEEWNGESTFTSTKTSTVQRKTTTIQTKTTTMQSKTPTMQPKTSMKDERVHKTTNTPEKRRTTTARQPSTSKLSPTPKSIDVNIQSTELPTLYTNPKIVITEQTVTMKSRLGDNIKQKRGSHQPVTAVLGGMEADGNGAQVSTSCWCLLMAVFVFTVI